MKGWIVVFDGVDQFADVNADAELFSDLPCQSLTSRRAGLDLAAGELPLPFEIAVAPGGCKDFRGIVEAIADHCGHYFDRLHWDIPPFFEKDSRGEGRLDFRKPDNPLYFIYANRSTARAALFFFEGFAAFSMKDLQIELFCARIPFRGKNNYRREGDLNAVHQKHRTREGFASGIGD